MKNASSSEARTSLKLRWFALTSLAIGIAGSIDPLIGFSKAWGILPGGPGEHRQGLLGLMLAIGAAGLLFKRKWGRVVVSIFCGFVLFFCVVAVPVFILRGMLLPAGLALLLLAAPAMLALRFLRSSQVVALTAAHARPYHGLAPARRPRHDGRCGTGVEE